MSIGNIVLVIVALIGYFALFPAMVVSLRLEEEGRFDEADYTWRRVYWVGFVASLTAVVLIMYMP